MRKTLSTLILVFTSTFASFAQNGEPLPLDPAVRKGTLPNGLTYYIRANKIPEKRAELYLVNKVGSILEDENQRGLAHFVEHMAFNGTRDFPKNTLIDYLQKAGVKFGADINAYTSFDETVYQLPIPTDTLAVFERGFDMLLNWAGFISFDPEEVNAERGVILEESRQRGKNAQERMQQQALPILFNNSRYAERIPIGKEDVLKSFTVETIKKFYKDWYRPDLQAIIAVGDFDADQVERWIKEKFAVLKNPAQPRPRTKYEVGDHAETFAKVITDKEFPYTVAQVVYKSKTTPITTAAGFREQIRTELFNTMMAARIQEATRKPETPYFFAQNAISPFLAGLQAYLSITVAKNGQLDKAVTAVLEENEKIRRFGFTQTELDRAKKDLLTQRESAYKEKDKTKSAAYVAAYQGNFLTGTAVPGSEYVYNFYKKTVPEIQLKEVNELINTFDQKKNRVVLVQAPSKDSAGLPSQQQLLDWVNTDLSYVKAYEDQSTNEPLLSTLPASAKVASSKAFSTIGAELITLGNGVRVWLKPTDFKNDEIRFSSYSFGGTSVVDEKKLPSILMAANIMGQSGVGKFDPTVLGKMLTGKNVSVSAYVSEISEGVSGIATPADIETALQLVYLYYTAPRKDTTAFRTAIAETKYMLQNRALDPTAVFSDTLEAIMSGYHPRRTNPTMQMLDKVSLDEVVDMYKDRFADASDAVFVFVGNFDKTKLLPLLEKYIGGLPSTNRKESFSNLGIRPLPGAVKKTVYKGQDDKSAVELIFNGPWKWSPANNLRLSALTEIINIKMVERLREKEEGVYSPSVAESYSKLPEQRFTLSISFTCDPKNVDRLIEAALDEIRKIKKDGPSATDLQKFKAEERRAHEVRIKENGYWMNYLLQQSRNGEPVEEMNNYLAELEQLTPASLKQTAQLLNEQQLIKAILMPEKK